MKKPSKLGIEHQIAKPVPSGRMLEVLEAVFGERKPAEKTAAQAAERNEPPRIRAAPQVVGCR